MGSPRLASRFRRQCHRPDGTRICRRYSKVVSNWTGSAWTRVLHEKFLYDGWNLLGAFNGTNAAIIRSFLWGLDLSGSMQGAGGVGGLIAFRQHSGSLAGSHFAAYDGNGNVMALVDGKTGSTSARYEYDPFGQTIRASGTMATVNPVRFSSKVVDDETDYAYYGYRYLNSNAGRWLNRDPIGEKGGRNLYGFVANDPVSNWDGYGLEVTFSLIEDRRGDANLEVGEWAKTITRFSEVSLEKSSCGRGLFGWGSGVKYTLTTPYRADSTIYYRSDISPDQLIPQSQSKTVRQHEYEHLYYHRAYANGVDGAVGSLVNGGCMCPPCGAALENYLKKAIVYLNSWLDYHNSKLDCDDYGFRPEGRKKCQKADELAPKLAGLQDDANKALDAALKICK